MRVVVSLLLLIATLGWAWELYSRWHELDWQTACAFGVCICAGIEWTSQEINKWMEGV